MRLARCARVGLAGFVVAMALSSCGIVAGLDANTEFSGARVASGTGGGGGGPKPDPVNVVVPASCSNEVANDGAGIFVALTGTTAADCGSIAAPCSTVQLGIDQAKASGKRMVYVGPGTYVETVSLAAGVTVQGGWKLGTPWARDCDANRAGSVTLRAPPASAIVNGIASSTTVRSDAPGAALDTLQVLSKDAPSANGESLYGIFATAELTVTDVTVRTGNAGTGAVGANGPDGVIPPPENCRSGMGAIGQAGAAGAAGTFGAAGYVPAAGTPGGIGTPGTAGNGAKGDCQDNCITACAPQQQSPHRCSSTDQKRLCGGDGTSACGGGPGGGGSGGSGGGSSIAIYAWGAPVTVTGGGVFAMDAGNGGAGGSGGAAGPGAQGKSGNDAWCADGCSTIFNQCGPNQELVIGGVDVGGKTLRGGDGGKGGAGGVGGAGSSGAGGFSYAVFQGNGAKVATSSTTMLGHGNAGAAIGPGASGKADVIGP